MKEKIRPSGNSPETGSILIACLIILSTLTIYGAVLVSVVYERSINVSVDADRLQALYLAEAAIADAIHEVKLMRDPGLDGLGTIEKKKLGRGEYFSIHDPATLSIVGVGEVNDIQRRVRIFYEGV